MDRATSLATREVDDRLSQVVPLIDAAHGEALADGNHADTKSIIGGKTIPIENLHLEHVGHGRLAVEGELLVPDGRKSVADDLGLADVALAKVADGGQKISGLVHDAELGEGITLATGISGSKAASFNDTDSDTAHCSLSVRNNTKKRESISPQQKREKKKEEERSFGLLCRIKPPTS